jgi:hypothetical protein
MDKLKKEVEQVIRDVYGLHPQMVVSGIEVKFQLSTSLENGILAAGPETIPQVTKKRPYKVGKKVRKGVSRSLHREYGTSKNDIFCMRAFFSKWKRDPSVVMTGEQENFIAQTEGVRYERLSQETKSRMREIFEEVREKILFNKKNGGRLANV